MWSCPPDGFLRAENGKEYCMKRVWEYLEITFAALLMSVGIYFFIMPNGFSLGGVTGLSTVLGNLLPFVTPSMLVMFFNVLLLILGFVVIGKDTGARTVYCTLVFSGMTWLFELLFPLSRPLTDEPLLELVYGVLLSGLGSAILFNLDASSGGTDIVALILKKYSSMDVGRALLCVDFFVSVSSFFVFGLEAGLFSLLGLFAKSFLVDGVIENLNACKVFTIITTRHEPIAAYILNEMHHSATTVDAVGEYAQQERKIIYTLCRRSEGVKLKKALREIDPGAFVIIESTSEIIGNGFRSI